MKKIILFAVIIAIFGVVLLQNGSLWMLRVLTLTSGNGTLAPSNAGALGPKPPFKDGTFTGNVTSAFYGNIQVQAVISGGKITDVNFLQYPNDSAHSLAINSLAMPNLKQEAIQAQTSSVDIVSGATDSSYAFVQSLAFALSHAK
jgi:uncharacterized protein with FMN-binding domain